MLLIFSLNYQEGTPWGQPTSPRLPDFTSHGQDARSTLFAPSVPILSRQFRFLEPSAPLSMAGRGITRPRCAVKCCIEFENASRWSPNVDASQPESRALPGLRLVFPLSCTARFRASRNRRRSRWHGSSATRSRSTSLSNGP